ncbi:dihydroorotase [Salirhabdus salicampi]|uniref:dihydroorotase n=1 Tax=Salirhabdus salicampi TaxID=476102 RepID=UPI0020C41B76|nr:dihydroorotase family protein [Salirhabdus salicampi]
MFDLEIINSTIVTPTLSFRGCVSISNGKIAAVTESPLGNARKSINAEGLYLTPGMVDQHVHFMDPAETSREDFIHGSSAAAVGGVTTVSEHTHSAPVRSVKEFDEKINHLSNRSLVDFGLTAHVFPEDVGGLKPLWDRGILFFKIFTCTTHGIPTLNNDTLYNALTELASFNGRCLIHCEDDAITEGNEIRLKEQNRYDNKIISEWRSEIAEEVAAANVAFMTRKTGAHVTIAHVSHPLIIDLIKREQMEGANIFAEICPQYLFLDEEQVVEKGPFGKFTPPARKKGEGDKLIDLINDKSIQILSSDHAPSTVEQKLDGNIWECNFGLPGVETTLPMMLDLVNQDKISFERLVQIYSEEPAKALGLYPNKGSLLVGTDADLVLIDLSEKWTIKSEDITSKAGWTPYDGKEVMGKPVLTMVRGKIVAENGGITADPGAGSPVTKINSNNFNAKAFS